MNRMMTAAASIAAAALLPTTALAAPTWTLDVDHSQVGFKVRHMMVSYSKGRFLRFQGTVLFDDAHPEDARIDVTIDAASIETGEPNRDGHLRSEDLLHVQAHPQLRFRSTSVFGRGHRWAMQGVLTIRGTSRPVELDVDLEGCLVDGDDDARASFSATTVIDRTDFGLTWNQALETGGVLVGEQIHLELDVQLVDAS